MSTEPINIVFKEWLPDLPATGNPGLIEALNTIPHDMAYKSFAPLVGTGLAMPYIPTAAYLGRTDGRYYAYGYDTAGGNVGYYMAFQTTWTAKSGAGGSGEDGVDFVEFDNLIIGSVYAQPMQCITSGSGGSFTALATSGISPDAGKVGVIGRIVVAGGFAGGASGTNGSYVRWSAIDNPRSWPQPGSDTAIANQSGEQWLDPLYGACSSIVSGDQYGLIFQRSGINRVTYVGGSIVFQFDNYEAERGAFFKNATINISGATYFVSDKGFFVTDGTSVKDIGTNKVTRTFLAEVDFAYYFNMRVAMDGAKNLIYWSYPTTSATAGRANRLLIYNYAEGRWTRAIQESYAMFNGGDPSLLWANKSYPMAFTTGRTLGSFSGSPTSAIFTTGETEINPGGYARVSGVKPIVDATVNAVTVAIGARDDLGASPTYTSETTANARSRYADFRSEARYHRARLTIAGTFNSAQGIEALGDVSGKT